MKLFFVLSEASKKFCEKVYVQQEVLVSCAWCAGDDNKFSLKKCWSRKIAETSFMVQ